MILEVCANSFESALAAQEAGAHRIELCTELSVGGLTPSYGLIEKVLTELTIPVHVLLRPRAGNFTYTESEIDVMLKDIELCKKLGVAGIVSGVLSNDFSVDVNQTRRLLNASESMDFTFHRAFDWCANPSKSLEDLLKLGVTRLLSSGQETTATAGIELLVALKNRAGSALEVMPGGGINESNALLFKEYGFESIHCSASEKVQTLASKPKVPMQGTVLEGVLSTSSKTKIEQILKLLS